MSTRFTFNPFYKGDIDESEMGSWLITVEYRGVPACIGTFDEEQHYGRRWAVMFKNEAYRFDDGEIVGELEPTPSERTEEWKQLYRMPHWEAMNVAQKLCLQVREEVLERIAKMNAREEGDAK